MACSAGPSFHEANGSAASPMVGVKATTPTSAAASTFGLHMIFMVWFGLVLWIGNCCWRIKISRLLHQLDLREFLSLSSFDSRRVGKPSLVQTSVRFNRWVWR